MPRPKIAAQTEELTPDEAVQAAIEYGLEQRRWLRALIPFVWDQTPPASSPAVEFSRGMVRLAAAARICRILRSDQPTDLRLAEGLADQAGLAAE